MSDEPSNDVAIHGYPPIPSEIPTTKDGWRQRAIGLKLRLSAAESQNQALQEEVDRLRHVVRHESPDMISCSCGATRHGIAVENQALQERIEELEQREPTWADWIAWMDRHYPAHIFTGESGDPGPRAIAAFRAALSSQETDPG